MDHPGIFSSCVSKFHLFQFLCTSSVRDERTHCDHTIRFMHVNVEIFIRNLYVTLLHVVIHHMKSRGIARSSSSDDYLNYEKNCLTDCHSLLM